MYTFLVEKPAYLEIATLAIGAICLLFGYFAMLTFQKYEETFGGQRVKRTSKLCPSFKKRPSLKDFGSIKADIIARAERHPALLAEKSISDVKKKMMGWKQNTIVQEQAKALPFKGAFATNEIADELNMNHVHVRFADFLWAFTFVRPMTFLLRKKGTLILSIRQYLVTKGLLHVVEPDIDSLIGSLCLEQSQAINYFAKTKKESKIGNVGRFFFANFPYVDNDLNFCVADLFAVDIDLDTKRFVKAKLDAVGLSASETLILLSFNTVATQHVKIHAMANWGLNNDLSLKETNPFLRQNSVLTIMYNFLGLSNFQTSLKFWEKQGLVSEGWFEKAAFIKCINHGLKEGVGQHGNIVDLAPYSRFVNFTMKVRSLFMNEFAKHKHLFPGVDGEAFFVGTILHSLDHAFLEWNLVDPLWLDVDDKRFGKMAELVRILRVGFVEDLPFLYFNKRFSGSKHPFYRKVYEKARKIDKELADHMETCIIK